MNIKTFQSRFAKGEFVNKDISVQISAGWIDWFCNNDKLANKTKRIGNIISKINNKGKVDLENCCVLFKNNCPLNGKLFDDFRIVEIVSNKVLLTIQINCCWNKKRFVVWGRKNANDVFDCLTPLYETDDVKELISWFNSSW